MSDIKDDLTRAWLIKAQHDLLSAKELGRAAMPLLDTAAYHCQQAAEKALKAFLVYHDIRFTKTHDIEVLVTQAIGVEPRFAWCLDAAPVLTPLAVEFRYPGDYLEPEPEEFKEAFAVAEQVYAFVVKLLPPTTHPCYFEVNS